MIWLLAEQRLSWLSPLETTHWWLLCVACGLGWVVLRTFWGTTLVRRQYGLVLLRLLTLMLAIGIAMGPTLVDEQPGMTSRPAMVYLLDGSQSMQLGGESTRWHESLQFVSDATENVGAEAAGHCKAFRFGHRLAPLIVQENVASSAWSSNGLLDEKAILAPDATDSRLADALRQLSAQVDSVSSAGVVLLTDGRVRASESVERLAEHFGSLDVPIHVVPVGELEGTGDVAIVSLVVEPQVRKHTENQLTLFFRSFGYNGQRTVIRIKGRSKIAGADQIVLAEMPITLIGGAQSATLPFRVEDRPKDLTVELDPLDGELTDRNNVVQTRVEIDRTKLRVLYMEGEVASQQTLLGSLFSFGQPTTSTPVSTSQILNIRDALQADEDIECTVLIQSGNSLQRINDGSYQAFDGFPRTRAELFAYDCIVLSNVGPDVLNDEQLLQLALWLEGRGGGLIVTGTQAFEASSWQDNPLAPMLPILADQLQTTFTTPLAVNVTRPKHPIWRLRLEQKPNEQLIGALPPLSSGVSQIVAKPSAEILVTANDEKQTPVMVVHRAGRGRVIVSTADLGGTAFSGLAESWGPQPERAASKLWRNMVYWATEGSSVGRRRLVANSDKRFYRPGDRLSIDAFAYDEAARKSQKYRIWAMFEPMSLDDPSLYSPVLWPENVVRESGEVAPRIAWGEELPLTLDALGEHYQLDLMFSEASGAGDSGMRIEMTAYEGGDDSSAFDHGTQVDSTSLAIQILSDPFEQQNPLPNRELLVRLAKLSGGQVLEHPKELSKLLRERPETIGPPHQDTSPAWSQWWLWLVMLGLLTAEWIWRRATGLA